MPADDRLPRRAVLRAGAAGALAASTTALAAPAGRQVESRPGREVWIASLTLEGIDGRSRDDAVKQALARMESVAASRPDLICLPEIFNARYSPRPTVAQQGEPIDGPTVSAISAFAKAHACYVVAPITTRRDGKLFNTAVLIGRAGETVGSYDKLHPTEYEMDAGIVPGRSVPVFSTDFGKLGIQICFDIDWADGWKSLKEGGAELVVWPSAYPGGFPLDALAFAHRYPIVTSPWNSPARLIDIDGRTLLKSGQHEPWISAPFCLDRGLFHLDFQRDKVRAIQKTHGRDVTVRWGHDEGWFVLENRVPGKSLADLVSEFDLLPMDGYIARATKAQDRARG